MNNSANCHAADKWGLAEPPVYRSVTSAWPCCSLAKCFISGEEAKILILGEEGTKVRRKRNTGEDSSRKKRKPLVNIQICGLWKREYRSRGGSGNYGRQREHGSEKLESRRQTEKAQRWSLSRSSQQPNDTPGWPTQIQFQREHKALGGKRRRLFFHFHLPWNKRNDEKCLEMGENDKIHFSNFWHFWVYK